MTLALPLLDSMVPAATLLAQTAASPKPRFVGCFVPHGMAPGYWVPKTEGAASSFRFIFKPLEPYRDQRDDSERSPFPIGGTAARA